MKIRTVRSIGWFLLLAFTTACGKEDPNIHKGPYVHVLDSGDVEVSWLTVVAANSDVVYGVTRNYGSSVKKGDLTRNHSLVMKGLRIGQVYHFKVSSAGAVREGQFVAGLNFDKGPYSQNVRNSKAAVLWETNLPVDGMIEYGPLDSTGLDTLNLAREKGFREIELSGLEPGTMYGYRAVAGGVSSRVGQFRTPSASDTAFTFLLYGDSRDNPSGHRELALRMSKEGAAFTLHSGDFLKDGREQHRWNPEFFLPARSLLLAGPIYPSPGNHEHDAAEYYKYFSVPGNGSISRPESWYDFTYGNAHIVVLDTNPVAGRFSTGSEQLIWLERVLKGSISEWKLVMFHHPLYSSGRHKSNLEMRRILEPIFESYGVDMVMTGHDHLYERTWPLKAGKRSDDGLVHIVSGGGGAELYPVGRSAWTAVAESVNHYCKIRISGSRLDLDVMGKTGERIDVLTLYKSNALVDRLLEMTGSDDTGLQVSGVRELGRTGLLSAIPEVAALARAESVDLRREVAEALARMGGEEGRASLLALSNDEDVKTRRWAMQGLIDLGKASDVCLARLRDLDTEVRRLAAKGLERSPLRQAGPALALASRDGDARLRLAAVSALAANPHALAIDALVVALGDEESMIRRAAFEGVVAKGVQARAVPALITMLGVETSDMRREIVRVLGEAGERGAVKSLADRLGHDEDKRVRQASAIALARLKDKKAVPALVEALNDPDGSVMTYSMRALRLITGENKGDVAGWKDWWQKQSKDRMP